MNDLSLICIGLEATSMYGFHLLDYFSSTALKYPVEVKLYQVNAKYVSKFKKAFPEKEKTDMVDCRVIAEYLRFGRLPAKYKPECLFLPLRRLVRYRYHFIKNLEKERKIYMANLFLKFPGWVQNKPIGTLGKIALDVTGKFTPDQLAEMPLEELAVFVAKAGNTESEEKRIVRECDKYLRYYLVEAANSLRMHNEKYRMFYQKKYQEVPKHKHKRAIVFSARKLVRLVFALLSKNQLYDPLWVPQSPRLSGLNQNCQRANLQV
ncbi:MAG: transposase [Candidatus Cloacimonas acidaminovorans]|nr:transposase [Candidatus Cloacimonas acidaminovorans]